MSMEDILKALASSRQQGNSAQSSDPMTDLLGGLLGGGGQSQSQSGVNLSDGIDAGDVAGILGGFMNASQQQSQGATSAQPAGGVSGMMGMLEMAMGGGQNLGASNPIMGLIKPYIAPLAKKANISPEIAMIVVSFVAHKLLAHHPASGRDSNTFKFEDVFEQMGSGKINPSILENSGMVKELSRKTGLDEATAEKSLDMAFSLVGKDAASAVKSLGAKGSAQAK